MRTELRATLEPRAERALAEVLELFANRWPARFEDHETSRNAFALVLGGFSPAAITQGAIELLKEAVHCPSPAELRRAVLPIHQRLTARTYAPLPPVTERTLCRLCGADQTYDKANGRLGILHRAACPAAAVEQASDIQQLGAVRREER